MPNIGPMEIAIVLIIALVILGPKKLPGLGRGLGQGMREFRTSITGQGGDEPAELPAPEASQQAPSDGLAGSKAAVESVAANGNRDAG